jgi:Fe-S cluster assembly iron-binding protein IscA
LTTQPLEGDEVVDAGGALVFVAAHTAPMLADKTLDAQVADDGAVSFTLADSP